MIVLSQTQKKKKILFYIHTITTTVTIECGLELPFVGDALLQPSSSLKLK